MKITKILLLSLITLSITSCGKDDPCENIICTNGGSCVNGECNCPEGYEGPDCSNQSTPKAIEITSIQLQRFPSTDTNGAGWDLLSGADIYVSVWYNNDEIYKHPTFFENAGNGFHDFKPNVNLQLENPLNNYVIRLYDYDEFDQDDFMGGIEFQPYTTTNNFPRTLVLDAGGAVKFELSVDYIF